MIEIMINHAEQHQIAHALEQISLGEKVLLSSNGKSFVVLPADEPVMPYEHNPKATMKEVFKNIKIQLPPDYKFDREEANSR
ncbi:MULTISPECIES: hypothetical protein [Moraxella]|uniref:Uncharacterized protein n=1 Tax=Moraxella lacunata TaxID=477 RepID=A0A1B8Q7N9_MORLA|nr:MULTISPECIES: hypothetical protein [Moraxella]MBE9579640.1 hypothetical protein [Moraxella sp. K1664]MBE9587545.1 hypothetical protein [Moraxella sp. K1630]MBE9597228.1 hypothetical protein [Moraxella sp. K2450]MDH9217769.1 hypothetical protein [Moraxella lacunata]MDI4483698.1 hypothetical protein [Moraxella lacunata]